LGTLCGVHRAETDDRGGGRVLADGAHRVGLGLLQLLDELGGDVGEHHLAAALVQQQPYEAATDVAGPEMHCPHRITPSRRRGSRGSPRWWWPSPVAPP